MVVRVAIVALTIRLALLEEDVKNAIMYGDQFTWLTSHNITRTN